MVSAAVLTTWNVYYTSVVIQRLLSLNHAQFMLLADTKLSPEQANVKAVDLQRKLGVLSLLQSSFGRAKVRELGAKKSAGGDYSDEELLDACARMVQHQWRSRQAHRQFQAAEVVEKMKSGVSGRKASLITFEKRFKEMLERHEKESSPADTTEVDVTTFYTAQSCPVSQRSLNVTSAVGMNG
jgi:superfamily II DNA helicase RecQ